MHINKAMRFFNNLPKGAGAAVIITPANRFYLGGFPSSEGILIISENGISYLLDGRYFGAAEAGLRVPVKPVLLTDIKKQLPEILYDMKAENVLFESGITVAELERYKNMLSGFKVSASSELDDIIRDMRMAKSEDEAAAIREAQRITEKAFDELLHFLRPDLTEREVAAQLEFYMKKNGADSFAFDTIAAAGKNSAVPHAVPGDNKLQKGDFLVLDFGARRSGYDSDMTRTVCIGTPTDEMINVYNTVLKAQQTALSWLRPGLAAAAADKAARDVIKEAGYGQYFTHSTGHGVGIDIHEYPNLSPSSAAKLKKGNVVTVEPGIYISGRFGVRIEDMSLITENGCENLTHASKELIIVE